MDAWTVVAFLLGAAGGAAGALAWRRAKARPASSGDRIIEISQLAGGLAHEIRNPLSTLLLNLKLLEEDLGEGPDDDADARRRARRKIDVARAEAERLQRMLDEFLLLVGPLGLKRSPADLNAVIDRLVEFYRPEAQRHGIALRAVRASAPVPCALDVQIFQQALLNLLINAQQAIRDRGEITIAAMREDGWARLDVADNGEGMTPEVAAKAMQAFYSTKPKGSGLGLSTTSRIVSAHGGNIRMVTRPGAGTRFEIRLPLLDPLAPIRPDATAAP